MPIERPRKSGTVGVNPCHQKYLQTQYIRLDEKWVYRVSFEAAVRPCNV